ncbi:unnamed protein product [Parnassius mnemosyne]|uniref:Sodium/hydrogen exchanger 10 n=1 Tax=Parnassius mnemosyne TaxID=213953 RepID=A0AAV1LAJ4_9NEOP
MLFNKSLSSTMTGVFLAILYFVQCFAQVMCTNGTNVTNNKIDNNTNNNEDIKFDDPSRPSLAYPTSLSFLFIFTTLLIGVVVRAFMLWTDFCLPYRVIMFTLGGIAGFCANRYPSFKPVVEICYLEIDVILLVFLPVLVFSTSYAVDSHSFSKSFPQILLVGVPGTLLTSLMLAFMAYYLIESSWNFPTAVLFGVVCAPIYPAEVVKQLKELSKGKYISVLLLGEGLIGDATVMIEFTAVFAYLAMAMSEASQISLLLLRFAGGGIILGVIMGRITAALLSITYNDLLCAVTLTLSAAYLTYYIGEKFFYVSGLLGTVIAGVIISKRKSAIAGEVEQVVSHFWGILSHAANTLVFTMVGVVIFEKVSYVISVRQVSLVFVTYSTVYCSRLMVYSAMTPILRHIGYGISWQHSMACVWGGLRGPLSLCLALHVLQTPGVADAGEIFIIQAAGLVLLSLLINAITMGKVLKILGLAEISLAKKANMTNCVKRIMMTRDRCISMLKMDKFLADANWDLVQQGTTIKHPYQIQMSNRDDDSEDDTYMGYHYTTCPDCEREIPNEPTKKEFAEMMREANQRVLKAMKISYWRQYEHGKISKDGVRTLVQAVEVAADSDDGRVNLEQLGTLWKPKAYAVWLRRKLVKMMTPEAATVQMPHNYWRRLAYRMVSNVWFDGFIYIMILCNTPIILCEVALRSPTHNVIYIIKFLNLFFYIIYVLEMVVKMMGLGTRGYFKSHWNKLDFLIIVMATGDLVLDIIDALTPWDKWRNLNSSVLTASKLLRTLRFLRLCKLARVSVPKVMAYIDRMIDIQLAFGYDVGKGFVTAEQEVCNLLPQLVDNIQIQEKLDSRLEADRLTVTRQLGLLQRDRPWTAITVKTRQATTSTLNIMILDTMQLKEEGFLDEMEYRLLLNAIQSKVQTCRHKGSLVAPSTPETQLRAISWLQGNERVADFFLENSEILNYNFKDILLSRGDEPKGLYIIVSGLLEATYEPPEGDFDEAIPNYEFLSDLKFNDPSQDYIVSGNAVGVLGVLTNRPYSYTVRCDTAVQAYFIKMSVIKEAFNLSPHPIMGLEAAMWREIGIKLSLMVLPSVPAYHGWSVERLSMRLEHAFVPCLKAFKVFVVNELMEDIVLIDGICQDMSTREVFQPPCYIPRTAHRLVFPKSSQLLISNTCPETKLLIVPAKDTDELDIMEDEIDDMQCELVSNASSRCLYHKVARRLSSESRALTVRRGRGKRRRAGARRVNYRESVWGKQISTPALPGSLSEKELNSKYYRPSIDDLPEKLEANKNDQYPLKLTAEAFSDTLPKKPYSESKKQNSRNRFNIATLNTRSLKSQEFLLELEHALETVNWDIIGLNDVRRVDEKTEERDNYILYHINEKAGIYGVGFMVKKYLKNEILEFRGISDRIAILNINLPGYKKPTSIVQIYAPTEVTQKDIKDEFYKKLNQIMPNLCRTVIIMGDFNSQIGKRNKNENNILGPYSTGKRNDNGQRLINFASGNNLHIMNSYYNRKHNRKWTWVSPDGKTKNEIDYILTNKPRVFLNIDVVNQLNYNTDHRMLRGQMYVLEPKTSGKNISNNKKPIPLPIADNILESLENNLKATNNAKDVQEKYDTLVNELNKVENKARINKDTKDKIGPEARNLIIQRKSLYEDRKINKKKIEILSKEINLQIRKHREKRRNNTINYYIEKLGGVTKAWDELRERTAETILDAITDLFNEILITEYIPHQWTTSTIVLLHKKGKKDNIANYRPISLMSNVYKIFSKVLLNRLTQTLDENQPREQAGFRSDFSTIDHIHTIKQIIEKCNEYGIYYYLAYVDYNKAFDSLKHTRIWEALATQGVENKYIRLISNIYKNMKAKIRTERVGDHFPIKRGWNKYGLNINGIKLNHLRFADDLILISEDPKSLQEMLEELVYESDRVGLSMNTTKTKVMTNHDKVPITVNDTKIEYVEEYIYLGQIISPKDLTTKEINNRVQLAWKRYWSLKEIFKNPQIPLKAKKKIFDSCILPIMTYGCQSWSLTKHNLRKLENCQHSMERSMLNIKLKDKIKLETLRNQTKINDVTHCVRKLKWKWAGHMMRNNKEKWAKNVTEWCPRQNKRKKGRQRLRWEDDIRKIAGVTWRRITQDRKAWQALGEAFADTQDNHKTDNIKQMTVTLANSPTSSIPNQRLDSEQEIYTNSMSKQRRVSGEKKT